MAERGGLSGVAAELLDEEVVRRSWGWFLALGILLVILGVCAVALPFATAVAINLIIGWLLVISAVAHVFHAFKSKGWRATLPHALVGVLQLVVGVMMILNPIEGVLALTVLLIVLFAIEGVFKIIMGIRIETLPSRGWVIFSGIVALVLAILIGAQFPLSAMWIIGLLVGIQLLVSGWSFIMIAIMGRRGSGGGATAARA
ncbi:MAG: HdeD family acid-resistance protein [Gammaproteobacteria bacterium]|nr:HdeD family acid-resistance protein [Gammaproteobacteria bacterium]